MMTLLRSAWAWLTGKRKITATLQLEDGSDLLEENGATPLSLEH